MDQVELVVCSQPRTDPWSKPRDYSWARATVDAEGRFSIAAISAGTLRYLVRYPEGFSYRPVAGEDTEQTHVSADDAEKTWTIRLGPAVKIRGTSPGTRIRRAGRRHTDRRLFDGTLVSSSAMNGVNGLCGWLRELCVTCPQHRR